MPQMAPISWLILFFIFSFSFIIFNMMNFYCFNNKPNMTNKKETKNLIFLNWKW